MYFVTNWYHFKKGIEWYRKDYYIDFGIANRGYCDKDLDCSHGYGDEWVIYSFIRERDIMNTPDCDKRLRI